MAEITINRDITGANEATIRESWSRDTTTISNDSEKDAGSAVAKLAKKFPDSSAIAADLLLCDYVKVRKVRIGQKRLKKTKVDKKLQVSGELLPVWLGIQVRKYNIPYI